VYVILDPERAVLVEGRDAILQRHEAIARRMVVARTNLTIASLAGPSFQEGGGSVSALAGRAPLAAAA
jgi:hypothetical protein